MGAGSVSEGGAGRRRVNQFAQLAESSASEAEESCSSDGERPSVAFVPDCWEERDGAVSETSGGGCAPGSAACSVPACGEPCGGS
eukprot:10329241-Alexandrium_andersonii.AAC.1